MYAAAVPAESEEEWEEKGSYRRMSRRELHGQSVSRIVGSQFSFGSWHSVLCILAHCLLSVNLTLLYPFVFAIPYLLTLLLQYVCYNCGDSDLATGSTSTLCRKDVSS